MQMECNLYLGCLSYDLGLANNIRLQMIYKQTYIDKNVNFEVFWSCCFNDLAYSAYSRPKPNIKICLHTRLHHNVLEHFQATPTPYLNLQKLKENDDLSGTYIL